MDTKPYELKAVLNTNFKPLKFRAKGKEHYQVFLSIWSRTADPDLSEVLFVQYELHHTFKERTHTSKSKKNGFEIEIKTWGTFPVKVTIYLQNGEEIEFEEDYGNVLLRKGL